MGSEPKARLVNSAKAAQMALAERPSKIYEVPRPWEFPSVEKIRGVQEEFPDKDGLKLSVNTVRLLVNQEGKVWIPEKAKEMKSRICIAAHAGLAGHRGVEATHRNVTRVFAFKGARKFVHGFVSRCVQCVKSSSRKMRPRPWGSK